MTSEHACSFLSEVIRKESGNWTDPARNMRFECRLAPVLQSTGAASLEELAEMLMLDRNPNLYCAVAEAMTVNETSFFRDISFFNALRNLILPNLIQQNRSRQALHIWSAGCSTGQEAYSVAMVVRESFPELASWDIKILGTDISRQVTDYAQTGRFRRLEVNRGLPARMLLKYFTRDQEEWVIAPELRDLCEFRQLNLCAPVPSLPRFDLILLRNVLLYFAEEDRRGIFDMLYRQIQPAGFLILGASEQAEESTTLFQAEFAPGCYFYRPVER